MSIVVQTAPPGQLLTIQSGDIRYVKKGTSQGFNAAAIYGTVPVVNGGTGVTTSTGTGSVVLNNTPTLIAPLLGTPTSGVATNLTGTAAGLTAGTVTTNANLTGVVTSVGNTTSFASTTGSGAVVLNNAPTLVGDTIISKNTPRLQLNNTVGSNFSALDFARSSAIKWSINDSVSTGQLSFDLVGTTSAIVINGTTGAVTLPIPSNLGTPSTLVGTNLTGTASGLTAGTVTTNANLTGAVTSVGNVTSLGSFTSDQLATAVTDEIGTGVVVFNNNTSLIGNTTIAGIRNAAAETITVTVLAGLNAGSASAVGTRLSGKVTMTTGAAPSTGALARLAFSPAFPTAPIVVITPADQFLVTGSIPYVSNETVNGFEIWISGVAPAGLATIYFNYICIAL